MDNRSTINAEEIARFAQHAAGWWDKEGPYKTLHDINPARLDFIERHCSLMQKTVLDVGCGGGILAESMAIKGAGVIGLDAEEEAIAMAQKHALANHLAVDYVCQPIEEYPDRLFDIVTCMEMLEHVSEPQRVIDHCGRLLKPGGLLFLSTLNRTFKAYLTAIVAAEYVLNLLPRQTHDFAKFIKPSELMAMARIAGLQFLDLTGIRYNPFNRSAGLQTAVDVNYLLCCTKP